MARCNRNRPGVVSHGYYIEPYVVGLWSGCKVSGTYRMWHSWHTEPEMKDTFLDLELRRLFSLLLATSTRRWMGFWSILSLLLTEMITVRAFLPHNSQESERNGDNPAGLPEDWTEPCYEGCSYSAKAGESCSEAEGKVCGQWGTALLPAPGLPGQGRDHMVVKVGSFPVDVAILYSWSRH